MRRYIFSILLLLSVFLSTLPYTLPTSLAVQDGTVMVTSISPLNDYYMVHQRDQSDQVVIRDLQSHDIVDTFPGVEAWESSFTPDDQYVVMADGWDLRIDRIGSTEDTEIRIEVGESLLGQPVVNASHIVVIANDYGNQVRAFAWSYGDLSDPDALTLVQNTTLPASLLESGWENPDYGLSPDGRYILHSQYRYNEVNSDLSAVSYKIYDLQSDTVIGSMEKSLGFRLIWLPGNQLVGFDTEMFRYRPDLSVVAAIGTDFDLDLISSWSLSSDSLLFSVSSTPLSVIFQTTIYRLEQNQLDPLGTIHQEIESFVWDEQSGQIIFSGHRYESTEFHLQAGNLRYLQLAHLYSSIAGGIHAFLLVILGYMYLRRREEGSPADLVGELVSQRRDPAVFSTLLGLWMFQNAAFLLFALALSFDALRGFPSSSVSLRFDSPLYYLYISVMTVMDLVIIPVVVLYTARTSPRYRSPLLKNRYVLLTIVWVIASSWRFLGRADLLLYEGLTWNILILQLLAFVITPLLLYYLVVEITPIHYHRYRMDLIKSIYIPTIVGFNLLFVGGMVIFSLTTQPSTLLGALVVLKGIVLPILAIAVLNQLRDGLSTHSKNNQISPKQSRSDQSAAF